MQLKSVPALLVQPKTVPGLLEGNITLTISQGVSDVKWKGPRISREVWAPVLAFFRDTFNRTHSECQVRLYVNRTTGVWAAWAFPQEAKSGMDAREIANDEAATQREQFKPGDGWVYSGTVHHHCGAAAFQSGTDRNNEKSQDGLHITIGKINEARFDMHARFYVSGSEFDPDMAVFWDIGDEARGMLPPELHNQVARYQMCAPPPADAAFPEQWKNNLIELRPAGFSGGGAAQNGANVSLPAIHHSGDSARGTANWEPLVKRRERAWEAIKKNCKLEGISYDEVAAVMEQLEDGPLSKILQQSTDAFNLSLWDVIVEWKWERDIRSQFPQAGDEWDAFVGDL